MKNLTNEETLKLLEPFMLKPEHLKVGQEIWTIQTGESKITQIDRALFSTGKNNYYLNGNFYENDKFSSAFIRNPFSQLSEYPKEMEVSMDNKNWSKRIVLCLQDGKYIAYCHNGYGQHIYSNVTGWTYAREIPSKTTYTKAEAIKRLSEIDGKECDII